MITYRIVPNLHTIPSCAWQVLDYDNNPFLSHAFLAGLEKYDCLGEHWQGHHIVIENDAELLGVMPLYRKYDSYGEFVFDWNFADAYHQTGRAYYPKLLSAVPFTPITGARLLLNKTVDPAQLGGQLVEAALVEMNEQSYSSMHCLFPKADNLPVMAHKQGLQRLSYQYRWFNKGYRDFQDFLDTLTSKKRKQILKERRSVQQNGVDIQWFSGAEVSDQLWDIFYEFYCATFHKKWGAPRFTLDFFKFIGRELADQVLLLLAQKDSQYVAGTFALMDSDTLYGRHWGCSQSVPFLHFELCYYQTIEYAILRGLKHVDAGVQGEHKLARGFCPVASTSMHWIQAADFRHAIADYLQRETQMVQKHIQLLNQHLAYKTNMEHVPT